MQIPGQFCVEINKLKLKKAQMKFAKAQQKLSKARAQM